MEQINDVHMGNLLLHLKYFLKIVYKGCSNTAATLVKVYTINNVFCYHNFS